MHHPHPLTFGGRHPCTRPATFSGPQRTRRLWQAPVPCGDRAEYALRTFDDPRTWVAHVLPGTAACSQITREANHRANLARCV